MVSDSGTTVLGVVIGHHGPGQVEEIEENVDETPADISHHLGAPPPPSPTETPLTTGELTPSQVLRNEETCGIVNTRENELNDNFKKLKLER